MALKLKTAPAIEPVSLAQAKIHLRVDSEAFEDKIAVVQSIAPGAHVTAASYSLEGTSVEVSGYTALAVLESGTNGAGGTVDVKLQDSDNGTTWADVSGGAFTQVTTSNDNATYETEYTGYRRYLRAVATVAGATCSFGVAIVKGGSETVEDTLISAQIAAARRYCESVQGRAYITQTWELWLDAWPDKDYIELPRPPLQEPAVTAGSFVSGTAYRILTIGTTDFTGIGASANTVGVVFTATGAGTGSGTATASGIVKYYGTDNTVYYMDGADCYFDKESEPGRLALAYGESWPSATLRPHNGVCVTYIAGYGDAAADVPEDITRAILLMVGHLYENREAVITGSGAGSKELEMAVDALLWTERVF